MTEHQPESPVPDPNWTAWHAGQDPQGAQETYQEGGPGYVPNPTAPPASGPAMPDQPPAGFVPVSAIREIMEQALERQRLSFDKELAQIRKEQEAERHVIDVSTGALGMTAEHGAGPGLDRAPTWSFHDQQLAIAGEHPMQQRDKETASK